MVSLLSAKNRVETILGRRTGTPWKVLRKRSLSYAYEFALEVPCGYSVDDVDKHLDALRASLGAPVERQDLAGVVVLRVITQDLPTRLELKGEIKEDLAVCLGFDRAGSPVQASTLNPMLLLAGCAGSGKTDTCRYYLVQVLRKYPDALLYICDMKGSSFLPFEVLANVHFTHTVEGVAAYLEAAHAEMLRRIAMIRQTGKREQSFPWVVILIDEIAELWARPGMEKEGRETLQRANSYLSSLVRIGRELKVAVWLATQYPTREILHNQIQSNLINRVCLHMDNALEYEVVLGHPLEHSVIPKIPGRAWVKGAGLIQIPYGGKDDEWVQHLEGMKKRDVERRTETIYIDRIDECAVAGYSEALGVLTWQFPVEKSIRVVDRIGKR